MTQLLYWFCLAALLTGGAFGLQAADFPARPVRLVVPSTPGGGLDVLARGFAPKLAEKWGQQIVIDDRAGAGGIIGTEIVAKSLPDGYNLLIVTLGFVINPFLYKNLPYTTPRDFSGIAMIGSTNNVLVAHPTLAARNVKELIALAKDKPEQINFASSGIGSAGFLSMKLLERMAAIKLTHIPYKGAGEATAAVVAGQTQLLITAIGAAQTQIKAGRLRAIALTGKKRSDALPEVPTMAESGLPGYAVDSWYAMFGPAAMPKKLAEKIYGDIAAVINAPPVAEQVHSMGFDISAMPPDELSAYINTELKTWGAVIKEAGIQAE